MTITAMISLYLLSWLGVEGNENNSVLMISSFGLFTVGFASLINIFMLVRIKNEHQRKKTVEMSFKQRSTRAISSSDFEEGMFAATLI